MVNALRAGLRRALRSFAMGGSAGAFAAAGGAASPSPTEAVQGDVAAPAAGEQQPCASASASACSSSSASAASGDVRQGEFERVAADAVLEGRPLAEAFDAARAAGRLPQTGQQRAQQQQRERERKEAGMLLDLSSPQLHNLVRSSFEKLVTERVRLTSTLRDAERAKAGDLMPLPSGLLAAAQDIYLQAIGMQRQRAGDGHPSSTPSSLVEITPATVQLQARVLKQHALIEDLSGRLAGRLGGGAGGGPRPSRAAAGGGRGRGRGRAGG